MGYFDENNFISCVNRALHLIQKLKLELEEEGFIMPVDIKSCRWAIEQAIINRNPGEPMMCGAIRYVEKVEYECELLNNI